MHLAWEAPKREECDCANVGLLGAGGTLGGDGLTCGGGHSGPCVETGYNTRSLGGKSVCHGCQSTGSARCVLCDLGQVLQPLCAFVASSVNLGMMKAPTEQCSHEE